ncbi:hypothetical protein IKG12_02245 [Candidatus Saccharibacteria bacterium]|nr:hypothetical protein [Candidatus Saccharibacteria bacterium]MBR3233662.1 hypothetical protein [Candidatus Saccharibacteria bacterium]
MNKIVRDLPRTLNGIYQSVMNGEVFEEPLQSVCEEGRCLPKDLYNFLEEKDPLVSAIYEQVDKEGRMRFPVISRKEIDQEVDRSSITPYEGFIWEQTSATHKETISEQTAITICNLVGESGINGRTATMYAILRDCGKKYTRNTDENGDICYRGSNIVSAYLAAAWIHRALKLEGDDLKSVIALVYLQDRNECLNNTRLLRRKLRDFFGNTKETEVTVKRISDLLVKFALAEENCTSSILSEDQKAKITTGRNIINSQ